MYSRSIYNQLFCQHELSRHSSLNLKEELTVCISREFLIKNRKKNIKCIRIGSHQGRNFHIH
jgi:hypothetical protein